MKITIDSERRPIRTPQAWMLRRLWAIAFVACSFAALSGCKNEKAPQAAPEASAAAAAPVAPAPQAEDAAPPAPSGDRVLADIYGDAKGGEFWFGRTFRLGDRRYRVGFASSLVEQAPTADDRTDAPEGAVSISQVTYVLDGSEWRKLSTARDIGRFGANDQAPVLERDDDAAAEFSDAARYLLAVPAWHTEMGGVEMHTAEVFAFDSAANAWTYVGSLYTGENDDAGCTDEGKTVSGAACTASAGELKFAANAQTGFPDISVIRSGTTLGNDGRARTLGAADAVRYVYSAESGEYRESQK